MVSLMNEQNSVEQEQMGMQGSMMPQEQPSGEADHLMSQIQQKKSEWDMVRNVGNVRKKMSKMKLLEQFFSMM